MLLARSARLPSVAERAYPTQVGPLCRCPIHRAAVLVLAGVVAASPLYCGSGRGPTPEYAIKKAIYHADPLLRAVSF
jgi:hypothetical protein